MADHVRQLMGLGMIRPHEDGRRSRRVTGVPACHIGAGIPWSRQVAPSVAISDEETIPEGQYRCIKLMGGNLPKVVATTGFG